MIFFINIPRLEIGSKIKESIWNGDIYPKNMNLGKSWFFHIASAVVWLKWKEKLDIMKSLNF